MSQKLGFTLAEVLITLGIIGVVASMTIPTLMMDINTKQWSVAANVFEKKLNEAMKNMNTAQEISGHPDTLSFVQELAKHFKTNKICRNDELQECFSDTVWWGGGDATPEEVDMTTIKQASHFGLDDWGTELIGVQFANGVSGLIAYNPECSGDPLSNQFKGTDCISMLYDVSGFKNPNTIGKDLGNFGAISRLGSSDCAFEIGGTCYSAPFTPTAHYWNACAADGTSSDPEDQAIMAQYGIQYCFSPVNAWDKHHSASRGYEDYWGGAVIACGGVDKMPTPAQLAELANYIYGTSDIGATDTRQDVHMSVSKFDSLGLNIEGNNSIFIWSNIVEDEFGAIGHDFYEESVWYTGADRNDEFFKTYALCVQ